MFALVGGGKLQVQVWRLLGFLDESMQQDHTLKFVHIKQNSCNAMACKIGSDLIQTIPKWTAYGIPMGQPNSTVIISMPISLRSSRDKPFSQSRTGSPPASVRKKIAGMRFCCTAVSDSWDRLSVRLPTGSTVP